MNTNVHLQGCKYILNKPPLLSSTTCLYRQLSKEKTRKKHGFSKCHDIINENVYTKKFFHNQNVIPFTSGPENTTLSQLRINNKQIFIYCTHTKTNLRKIHICVSWK